MMNIQRDDELAIEYPEAYEDFLDMCRETDTDPDTLSFDEYMREVAAEKANDVFFDR